MKLRKIFTCVLAACALCFSAIFSGCSLKATSFDWVVRTIEENYFWGMPEEYEYNGDIKAFAAKYLDRYSDYYTKEEYEALKATNAGSMSGVGISYMYVTADEYFGGTGALIETVVGNSPAYRSGLRAGELITGARDQNGVTEFDRSGALESFLTAKADGEQFTFVTDKGEHTLSKQSYKASYTSMVTRSAEYYIEYSTDGGKVVEKEGGNASLPEGAALIKLNQFYGDAADETAALVKEFNATGCTSLILDLRGNGGGYLDVMCAISDVFTRNLPERNNTAVIATYRDGKKQSFYINGDYATDSCVPAGVKVSVLADNGTASASEALMGVLIDNGVIDYGDICLSDLSEAYLKRTGTESKNCKSYGKGIMQSTFVRPFTKEALKLTTAKLYFPKGTTSIHDVGFTVSMGCKTAKAEWDVTYGDEQLAEAVQVLYAE